MAATIQAEPLLCCDECYGEPVPYTELTEVQGALLCRGCAFTAAAEAVAPLLSPAWTPTAASLRNAEEGAKVLEQFLAQARSRIGTELTKTARVDLVEVARSILFPGGR